MKTEANIYDDMYQWVLNFYKANYYLKMQELEKLERKHEKLKEKFKELKKKQ
jgi:hypothetical protein